MTSLGEIAWNGYMNAARDAGKMSIGVFADTTGENQEFWEAAGKAVARLAPYLPGPTTVDMSAAVVVGPNDYLLLGFRNASPAALDGIRQHLEDHHPGISDRILIANGPDTVAVVQTNGEKA